MKSYSFQLDFKEPISYFSQGQVTQDVRDLVVQNGFVFGKNVNKVNKIEVDKNIVKVKVTLLHEQTEDDLIKETEHLIKGLKKMKYKLNSLTKETKTEKKTKINSHSNKKHSKHKKSSKTTTSKKKKHTKSKKSSKKVPQKKSSFFNFF